MVISLFFPRSCDNLGCFLAFVEWKFSFASLSETSFITVNGNLTFFKEDLQHRRRLVETLEFLSTRPPTPSYPRHPTRISFALRKTSMSTRGIAIGSRKHPVVRVRARKQCFPMMKFARSFTERQSTKRHRFRKLLGNSLAEIRGAVTVNYPAD